MQAACSSASSCLHIEGERVASLHTTYYKIGPYRVALTDFTIYKLAERLAPSFTPFKVKENQNEEVLLQLVVDNQLESEDTIHAEDKSLQQLSFDWDDASCRITFCSPGEHLIAIKPKQGKTTYCLKSKSGFTSAHLGVASGLAPDEVHFVINNYLMMLYAFATAPRWMLLFHASAVVYRDKAYLFLGKSGTGKSTHSRLWLQYISGCHLLNDDNPLVEVEPINNQVIVYGSPWSGKTPCYRRESYPLGGLVRLEQAPANEMKRLTQLTAFAAVMPSCSVLRPEASVVNSVMQAIHQLIQHVPVFRLRCLPDREAALLSAHNLCTEIIQT